MFFCFFLYYCLLLFSSLILFTCLLYNIVLLLVFLVYIFVLILFICLGNYYSVKGQHEKAAQYFGRALKLNPHFSAAWTLMGHEYLELKNTHAAISCYRSATGSFILFCFISIFFLFLCYFILFYFYFYFFVIYFTLFYFILLYFTLFYFILFYFILFYFIFCNGQEDEEDKYRSFVTSSSFLSFLIFTRSIVASVSFFLFLLHF